MKIILRLSFCLLFFSAFSSAHAQQFDWVTGGGTIEDDSYLEDHPEATYFMCTDANGNIYALSTVGNDPVYADTFYSQGSYGSDYNFVVTSYTCTGQMRWAKLIASSGGECIPYGITIDGLGHVYVAGYFNNNTLHIGYDTSIVSPQYEYSGLIQFDTSGHFNWIRYVGDNDFNTAFGTLIFGSVLTMDGANNAHFINNMKSGVDIMPGVTSQYGEYDLTYNSSGTLLSALRLNMDSAMYINGAIIEPVTNKLFVSGENNISLADTFVTYAAAFDVNRNLLWMDSVSNDAASINSIAYDEMGHLYFGAGGQAAFSFNGYPIPAGTNSLVIKTDTNGNPLWIHRLYSTTGVGGIGPITLLPNNLIAATGAFAGYLTDNVDSILSSAGEGQNPFLTILDTSGVVKSLLQIHGDGFYDWGTSITSDKTGNIYIGGQVADSISAGGIPAYHSVGGNTDFFIMKYGVDCNCTSMPVANYTDTGAANTRGFSYTGTTIGIDSVVWNFGDNTPTVNSMSSITHTYDSGTYEACVYAYTACGSDMHCSKVTVTQHDESVTTIANLGVPVFPNPATNEVNITTQSAGITYRLMSITGVSLMSGSLQQGNNNVSLSSFAAGIYILEMRDSNGQVSVVRIVKE
jgi:hypothetical protein